MTQPPVRFENYPPEDGATREEPTPVIRPYVPDTVPPPVRSSTSRRNVVGLVLGIPLAGIIFSVIAAGGNARNGSGFDDGTSETTTDPYGPDDPGDPGGASDPGPTDEEFSVGSYTATAPAGWTVHDDGSGAIEVTNAANRLTAVSVETAASSLAVDEIAGLAKSHYAGFTGKTADPVDRSTADRQHATMDGVGRFQGKTARLLAELWIEEEGDGLLVIRVLTAKVGSPIAIQAQEMLNDLSGGN